MKRDSGIRMEKEREMDRKMERQDGEAEVPASLNRCLLRREL